MYVAKRYEIQEKLGQGGMGVVYRARDRLSGETVALKQVLLPENALEKPLVLDKSVQLSLALEFRALASLRHPYIVSVLDYGFDERQQAYYTMTFLEGAEIISDYARDLPQSAKIALLMQVLEALSYLHRRGIVHRDLKPDNILICRDGVVKVMDFGLALSDKASMPQMDNRLAGTLAYMSPELFQGKKPSVQSDLYALGMIAYEVFAECYPFRQNHIGMLITSILHEHPPMEKLENCDLAKWLQRLLAKGVDERYQSADEALEALCDAVDYQLPPEGLTVRESRLQAANFVARHSELNLLRAKLTAVKEGENAFILVAGESGSGKTRLVEELRSRAMVEGILVLKGSGAPIGGLPFHLWRSLLQRLILHVPVSDVEASMLKPLIPHIGNILEREVAHWPIVDARYQQSQVMNLIMSLFKRCSLPILLILEDLQWTEESLLPLRMMLQKSREFSKLMVVGTYRDDERPDLPRELDGMDLMQLRRLDQCAVAELSQAILSDYGKEMQVQEFLMRESEGNIFFILEAIRALAENLERLSEIKENPIPENVLTGGMREVLERRLQQMPLRYQPLLDLAAIIGRQIKPKILSYIFPHTELESWLYLGQALSLFEVQEHRWQFSHDKLRETVLSNIPELELRFLHRQVAEAIEAMYPDDRQYDETLMKHWHAAGNLDKELYYLNFVIQEYTNVHSIYPEAQKLLERSLDKLPEHDPRAVHLWYWQAILHWRFNEFDEAEVLLRYAYQLAETYNDRHGLARCLSGLGLIMNFKDRYEEAEEAFTKSIALFRGLHDCAGLGLALVQLGGLYYDLAEYPKAMEWLLASLGQYGKCNDAWGMALSQIMIGLVLVRQNPPELPDIMISGLEVAHQMMSFPLILLALGGYAHYWIQAGNPCYAAQIAGLMSQHVKRVPSSARKLNELLPALQAVLDAETLDAELARGQELALDKVVEVILVSYKT